MDTPDLRSEEFEHLVLERTRLCALRACRWMRCQNRQEDIASEAIAKAWKDWRRCVLAGRDPAQFVAALVGVSVRFAMGGKSIVSYVRRDEPLSPFCRGRAAGGKVVSLDEQRGNGESDTLRDLIADDGCEPWEEAIPRVDFVEWLDTLPLQQRDILERRLVGETCGAIAVHHRCTAGHVANLCCRLHGQYLHWSL